MWRSKYTLWTDMVVRMIGNTGYSWRHAPQEHFSSEDRLSPYRPTIEWLSFWFCCIERRKIWPHSDLFSHVSCIVSCCCLAIVSYFAVLTILIKFPLSYYCVYPLQCVEAGVSRGEGCATSNAGNGRRYSGRVVKMDYQRIYALKLFGCFRAHYKSLRLAHISICLIHTGICQHQEVNSVAVVRCSYEYTYSVGLLSVPTIRLTAPLVHKAIVAYLISGWSQAEHLQLLQTAHYRN